MSWLSDRLGTTGRDILPDFDHSKDWKNAGYTAAAAAALFYGGGALMGSGGGTAAGATAAGGAGAAGAAGAAGGTSALSAWGPALLGGGLSLLGGERANEQSQANSREQMAFQERMSSTAHQRQVADLKAAGLNPILSANAGAAAGPGASSQAQNTIAPALESAMAVKSMQQGIERQNQEIQNMKSSNSLTQAQIGKTHTENNVLKKEAWKGELADSLWSRVKKSFSSTAKQIQSIRNSSEPKNFQPLIKGKPHDPNAIQLHRKYQNPRKP